MMKALIATSLLVSSFAIADEKIDREAIRRVIGDNLRAYRTCYERQLEKDPNAGGKLVVSWTIDENGNVKTASVLKKKTSLKNVTVQNCVLDKIKSEKFPATGGPEVTINYPFYFSSK